MRLRFQFTPDTEAPAEMNIDLPDRRLLCMAENCTSTLHNVYTPRGAQIRDALAWSKYINESIELFGATTDIVFISHHWPRFGNDAAVRFLAEQRDTYRWIHDETMRLANHGETALEIAETLGAADPASRPGPTSAVTTARSATTRRRCTSATSAGSTPTRRTCTRFRRRTRRRGTSSSWAGSTPCVEKVQASIRRRATTAGWRRCSTTSVFADPDERDDVRLLQADCLEQLGYRAESGPWRDFYLTGAQELRHGAPHLGGSLASSVDVLRAMTTEMLVDLMGVRLDGARAESLLLNLTVTDRDDRGVMGLDHGALRFTPGRHDNAATVGLALPHLALARLASGLADLDALGDEATVTGDRAALARLLGTLDTFDASFAIVTP